MEIKNNSLNVILLGMSGSGKGTQAQMLVDRYDLEYIGTGGLLRDFSKKDNVAAKKLKIELSEGRLAPTWLPFYLWMDKLASVSENKGILFDGSPRKINEAILLEDVLKWYGRDNVKVVLIEVSEEESYKRLISRGMCLKCGKSDNIESDNTGLDCKHCDGKMDVRPEDTPDAIKTRIEWFAKEVSRVVEFYEKQGNLIKIDGGQSVEKVSEDIIKAIESK